MINFIDLHGRLETLSRRLDAARAHADLRAHLHDSHDLTHGELRLRHKYLTDALKAQIAPYHAQEQRITALEQDVLAWMNQIDLAVP